MTLLTLESTLPVLIRTLKAFNSLFAENYHTCEISPQFPKLSYTQLNRQSPLISPSIY